MDRSQPARPGLVEIFSGERSGGTLIIVFGATYDVIAKGQRPFCLAHLLRELHKVDASNPSSEWQAFSQKTWCLFGDALHLWHRENFAPTRYPSRTERLQVRLIDLIWIESPDAEVQRLTKRLRKYWNERLTFLDEPGVEPTPNV